MKLENVDVNACNLLSDNGDEDQHYFRLEQKTFRSTGLVTTFIGKIDTCQFIIYLVGGLSGNHLVCESITRSDDDSNGK